MVVILCKYVIIYSEINKLRGINMKRKSFMVLLLVGVICFAASCASKPTQPVAQQVTAESQEIGLSGVVNARELGGLKTQDGKTVKTGLVFRSGKLADATEEDIKKLTEEYHLATVIDFRTSIEVESAPNPSIEGVENKEIRVVDEEGKKDIINKTSGATDADPVDGMIQAVKNGKITPDMYISIIKTETGQKGYAEFFRTLLAKEEGKSILFHCTSGKDRTGIAAVLFLTALGVDEETILNDFELSNEFFKDQIAYMEAAAKKKTDDEEVIETVKNLTGVSRSYMERMISYLNEEYGSVYDFIIKKLDVSEADIEKLREMYLE